MGGPVPNTLRLRISGLDDEKRVEALKRSLGLVADVQGVVVDPERGEVHLSGDPDEHRVVVHLANEGFVAQPVHEPVQHPRAGGPMLGRSTQSTGFAIGEDRSESASSDIVGTVKDAIGGPRGHTKTQTGGKIEQVTGQVRDTYSSARAPAGGGASALGAELDRQVRTRPTTALLIAIGTGYVLARLLQR